MRVSRFVLGAILMVVLLFGLAPSASAANGTVHTQAQVEWVIDSPTCADVPSDVTGSGILREVTHSRASWRGLTYVNYKGDASGTAVDEAGVTYRWIYHNTRRYAYPDDGTPFQMLMTDSFQLVRWDGVVVSASSFAVLLTWASPDDASPISFDHFYRQRGYSGPGFPPCDPL